MATCCALRAASASLFRHDVFCLYNTTALPAPKVAWLRQIEGESACVAHRFLFSTLKAALND